MKIAVWRGRVVDPRSLVNANWRGKRDIGALTRH
jgi:hypothetical protein